MQQMMVKGKEGERLLPESEGFATVTSSLINLFDEFVGLAAMSLPWCFAQTGLTLGLVSLLVVSVVLMLSFDVLVGACEVSKIRSYHGLAQISGCSEKAVETCRAFYLFGISLACTVLVVDSILGSGTGLAPALFHIGTHDTFKARLIASCGFHGLTTLPLALSRTLEGFKNAAALALGTVVYACVVIFLQALTTDVSVDPLKSEPLGVLAVIPALNYMFLMHANIPRYYDELRHRNPARMRLVTCGASLAAVLLYAFVGASGLYAFGPSVSSNVLLDFSPTDTLAITARAAILVCAATTLSKIVHPMRDAVVRLFSSADPLLVAHGADALGPIPYTILTALIVAFIAVGGALAALYGFGIVLSVNSALFGSFVGFYYPSRFFSSILSSSSSLQQQQQQLSQSPQVTPSLLSPSSRGRAQSSRLVPALPVDVESADCFVLPPPLLNRPPRHFEVWIVYAWTLITPATYFTYLVFGL